MLEHCDYRADPSANALAPAEHPDYRDDPNCGGAVVGPFPDLSVHNTDLETGSSWDQLSDFKSPYQGDRGDGR